MPEVIYWIEGPWPGRLAIVARPRGGEWLEDDVALWQRAGFKLIVSLLTNNEILELNLGQEGEFAQGLGLEYISFPVADRYVPTSWDESLKLVQHLAKQLEAGKQVGIHCRHGIGRSALLAASLLIKSGSGVGLAFERIEKARGCPVPDTPEQRQWTEQFARKPLLTG